MSDGESQFLMEGQIIHVPRPGTVGDFNTLEEASVAMKKAGWYVRRVARESLRGVLKDDHRCAECSEKEEVLREQAGHHAGFDAAARPGAMLQIFRTRDGSIIGAEFL